MNVETLIKQLKQMADPNDEVFLIVEENFVGGIALVGIFDGRIAGTGTGAETGRCEIYGTA